MGVNSEQIFSILKKCDSKNPMPLSMVADKCQSPAGLDAVIQQMYDARAINRCAVTRGGVTQIMVWPTGVPEKASFKAFSINPNKPLPAECRMENNNEGKTMQPKKSKARIMLEIIAAKGSATGKELLEASGASAVKPFIQGFFDRGLIESTGDYLHKTYALAPGVTGEQLLRDGRIKYSKKLKEEVPEILVAEQVDQSFEDESEPEPPVPLKPRFRLASTSDKTLLLFGLSQDPIELDAAQTQMLVKFVSGVS